MLRLPVDLLRAVMRTSPDSQPPHCTPSWRRRIAGEKRSSALSPDADTHSNERLQRTLSNERLQRANSSSDSKARNRAEPWSGDSERGLGTARICVREHYQQHAGVVTAQAQCEIAAHAPEWLCVFSGTKACL